jgi:wyosine [tRNA(Phe)-imidazoG37] synthetase (radical SAM superfamily)
MKHIFGPVASRRLGRSLGIDLVPFKTCTWNCIYCECGHTTHQTADRAEFVPLADLLREFDDWRATGGAADVITLAGSGEPTLYVRIGELIAALKERSAIPVCVLTNGTLLWRDDVRRDLQSADIVIPTFDAPDEAIFQRIHRPCRELVYAKYVEGLRAFARDYRGRLWLEVFIVPDINDSEMVVRRIAAFAAELRPAKVQLNTAVRPGAEPDVHPLALERMRELAALFTPPAEVIGTHNPNAAACAGVTEAQVLETLRRRPCTLTDLAAGLGIPLSATVKLLDALRARGAVSASMHDGQTFFTATY